MDERPVIHTGKKPALLPAYPLRPGRQGNATYLARETPFGLQVKRRVGPAAGTQKLCP